MIKTVFPWVFFAGWVVLWLIRLPYLRRSLRVEGEGISNGNFDQILVGFLFLGTSVIPLLYILTPWLEFAKYSLPTWVGWFAISLLILGLSTLRKVHLDLGYSYSQDLEIKEGHTLVTEGIYKYLRHPMYTAGFLIAFAQMGLLQNWIAGLSGIVALGLFYSLRVPKEEEMLQTHFGEEYAAYREKTGGHFPFW